MITQLLNEYGIFIMSSIAVIILGLILVRMFKEAARTGKTIGKVIHEHFIAEFDSWIMIVMVLLWVTESLIAASIHPISADGTPETQINAVARFLSHFGTAMVGILMVIYFPRVLMDFIQSFVPLFGALKKELPMKIFHIMVTLLLLLFVGYAIIRIPYYNIELIARGLGDSQNVDFAWWEMWGRDVDYTRFGLPPDYNPLQEMQFQMRASYILLMSHYLLAIIDAIKGIQQLTDKAISIGAKRSNYSPDRDYTPSQEEVDRISNDPLAAIKELLMKVTNLVGTDLQDTAEHLKDVFITLPHIEEDKRELVQNKISGRMATLKKKWEKYPELTRGMTQSAKEAKKRTLRNETKELFARREGFNYQLPSGN